MSRLGTQSRTLKSNYRMTEFKEINHTIANHTLAVFEYAAALFLSHTHKSYFYFIIQQYQSRVPFCWHIHCQHVVTTLSYLQIIRTQHRTCLNLHTNKLSQQYLLYFGPTLRCLNMLPLFLWPFVPSDRFTTPTRQGRSQSPSGWWHRYGGY